LKQRAPEPGLVLLEPNVGRPGVETKLGLGEDGIAGELFLECVERYDLRLSAALRQDHLDRFTVLIGQEDTGVPTLEQKNARQGYGKDLGDFRAVNDLRADTMASGGAHRQFGAESLPPLRQPGFQSLTGNRPV
jgi:hypothetical protein